MKNILLLLIFASPSACTKNTTTEKKEDKFFFVKIAPHSKRDTVYIDKPEYFDTSKAFISRVSFCNVDAFCGEVTKYDNRPAPIDGADVTYQTNDLGIIYSVSTTWKSYRRLHSTNDSIERRISEYIDHILSRSDLVMEGDIPLKYADKLEEKIKMPNQK